MPLNPVLGTVDGFKTIFEPRLRANALAAFRARFLSYPGSALEDAAKLRLVLFPSDIRYTHAQIYTSQYIFKTNDNPLPVDGGAVVWVNNDMSVEGQAIDMPQFRFDSAKRIATARVLAGVVSQLSSNAPRIDKLMALDPSRQIISSATIGGWLGNASKSVRT